MPMFKSYIEMEFGLESFDIGYSAHFNHVIQEFLFGYNLLLKCQKYLKDFDYEGGRKTHEANLVLCFFHGLLFRYLMTWVMTLKRFVKKNLSARRKIRSGIL